MTLPPDMEHSVRKAPWPKGPYSVHPYSEVQKRRWSKDGSHEYAALTIGAGAKMLGEVVFRSKPAGYPSIDDYAEMEALVDLWISAPDLVEQLRIVSDLFALEGEDSFSRFERLAQMFRKDTGYMAPGKDQPMGGADQPDGEELRQIYDGWFAAKVANARALLAKIGAA